MSHIGINGGTYSVCLGYGYCNYCKEIITILSIRPHYSCNKCMYHLKMEIELCCQDQLPIELIDIVTGEWEKIPIDKITPPPKCYKFINIPILIAIGLVICIQFVHSRSAHVLTT